MTLEEVRKHTIIEATVGSQMLGLATDESDVDQMGVCIEPIQEAMGVGAPFEQWVAPEGGPDLTIYSLRKFLRLALKGNPTLQALLFVRDASVRADARGLQMQELAPHIVSRRAAGAYLGYLQAQRQRLTGERGQMRVHRADLVEKYGFDTKYAMHMLRLGIQGIELQLTGSLQLPMKQADQDFLLAVRRGDVSLQQCLTNAGIYESELKDLYEKGPLPLEPNTEHVERWMVRMYLRNWSATRTLQDRAEDAAL